MEGLDEASAAALGIDAAESFNFMALCDGLAIRRAVRGGEMRTVFMTQRVARNNPPIIAAKP